MAFMDQLIGSNFVQNWVLKKKDDNLIVHLLYGESMKP